MSQAQDDRPLDPAKVLHEAVAGLPEDAADPRFPTLDELRERFPQYEILGRVGAGGMGAVYRAQDRKLERPVALKILARELSADPALPERFLREARALAALHHPHVLTVHDFGETGGLYYLVTEYVDGVDLRRLMKMGALSPEEALRLAPQICSALQYAHEHGIVHRDVKPENVLIDADGNVRIADFGLAKLVVHDPKSPTLTRSSQVLGTPRYMAPEQWREGSRVDHRADIYALGVVLYEMLTGEVPMGHFAPPSKRAGTPPRLDEVVRRSLAQEPTERYDSARAVQEDLEDVARGMGEPPPRPAPAPAPNVSPAARLDRLPLWGLGFVALLLLAGLGFAIGFQRRVSEESWNSPQELAERTSGSDAVGAPLLLVAMIASAVILLVVGVWSTRRIRNSRGRLRGMGLAVTCTWLPPLVILNAAILFPLTVIESRDLFAVAMSLGLLACAVGDVFFLGWMTRRQLATM